MVVCLDLKYDVPAEIAEVSLVVSVMGMSVSQLASRHHLSGSSEEMDPPPQWDGRTHRQPTRNLQGGETSGYSMRGMTRMHI